MWVKRNYMKSDISKPKKIPQKRTSALNWSIPEYFIAALTGKKPVSIIMLLVSDRGTGKSYSALSLAHDCAQAIAQKRRRGTWEDYFPIDKENQWLPNCAVINRRDMITQLKQMNDYGVYVLDDIGVGWGDRNKMELGHMLLTQALQTTKGRKIIFMTAINKLEVNVKPHSIIVVFGRVSKSNHEEGFNTLTVYRCDSLFSASKLENPYTKKNTHIFTTHKCQAPPPEIAEAYDNMREIKTHEYRAERLSDWQSGQKSQFELF